MDAGIVIASALGVALAFIFVRALAQWARTWAPSWSASATSSVMVSLSLQEVLEEAEGLLTNLPNLDWIEIDEASGQISARTRGNLKTFGSALTLAAKPQAKGRVEVVVHSRAAVPQLYDWGVNRQLAQQIAECLMRAEHRRSSLHMGRVP